MTIIVEALKLPEDTRKWHMVADFFRLRKEVFVERLDWPLHTAEEMEYEQYDSFSSVYIIAHEDGVVLGGTRLLRTTTHIGSYGTEGYSYMLRDAHLGKLDGLPSNICDELPPIDEKIWELTRLASDPKAMVGREVLNGANDFLHSIRATHCLVLARPALFRMAKSMGFMPRALGKIRGNENGKFIAFESTVIDRNNIKKPSERRVTTTA